MQTPSHCENPEEATSLSGGYDYIVQKYISQHTEVTQGHCCFILLTIGLI